MSAVTSSSIWVYLAANPLLWLTATLVAYAIAERLATLCGRHPLANPVAIATALLAALLLATDTPYETFFDGAQFVHFLLGPATVALAVPLYRNLDRIKARLLPMGVALLCGAVAAVVTAVATAALIGAPHDILVSLAPKSVTTPIAMSLAEGLGGVPTLTAVLVIVTGIFGAMVLTPLMRLLRVTDHAAIGFAAGLASHGIGAARAFQIDATAGAFAGIGLGLNGAVTAVLLPVILPGVLALVG